VYLGYELLNVHFRMLLSSSSKPDIPEINQAFMKTLLKIVSLNNKRGRKPNPPPEPLKQSMELFLSNLEKSDLPSREHLCDGIIDGLATEMATALGNHIKGNLVRILLLYLKYCCSGNDKKKKKDLVKIQQSIVQGVMSEIYTNLKLPDLSSVILSMKNKKNKKVLSKEEEHRAKFFYLLKSCPNLFLPSMFLMVQKLEEMQNEKNIKKINFLPRRRKFRLASVPISNTAAKEVFKSLFLHGKCPENIWKALFHVEKETSDWIPTKWEFADHINTNGISVSVLLKRKLSTEEASSTKAENEKDEDGSNESNSDEIKGNSLADIKKKLNRDYKKVIQL